MALQTEHRLGSCLPSVSKTNKLVHPEYDMQPRCSIETETAPTEILILVEERQRERHLPVGVILLSSLSL